ncbi:MAG: hypothetical protein K2N34_02020 [Lachnospiraceae bacterium]|nr:hypothetical protein [Lachnospiraceae bacterium]
MKVVISIIISLLSYMSLCAQSPIEYFSVGNPIKYCGTEYTLAWSGQQYEKHFLQEYLPKGETLEHYNQMFTVSIIFWDRTPLEAIQAKIAELEQRKKTDPVTNYMVVKRENDYILEFIVADSTDSLMNLAEVDVHYYKQMTINGKRASVLSFYSCRAYGDDILPFIQSIPEKRAEWYEGMVNLKIDPKFPNK